jgi:hypothetical protein|tara:strand:+ start:341 stop:523 length:183 start_codon:yes stop_codon:yes gene_type:complete
MLVEVEAEIFIVQLELVDQVVVVLVVQGLMVLQLQEVLTLEVVAVEKDQLLKKLVMVDQE